MGRSIRKIPALGLAAAALWVAAPALSTTPYIPEAVDFEQELTDVNRVASAGARSKGEGPVTYKTGVIAAPHRFDAVGLAKEMRPLEIRARLDGGEWSDWIEVANGDPLIAVGGGDEAQLRTRGWRPEGTLHYVNVTGTADTTDSALTAVRGAINSAVVSVGSVISPAAAQANVSRPHFMSREKWGAERDQGGCKPRGEHPRGRVKSAAVHHTVTSNSYTRAEAPGIVLAICRYHRYGNDWNDIGYNMLVDRFGKPYVGREGGPLRPVMGAHTQGFNDQTTGVAVIGTHTSAKISDAAFNGLAHVLAWKLNAHGLRARGRVTLNSRGGSANRYPRGKEVRVGRIFGHGRLGKTACPGDALRDQIDALRNAAQHRINN